MRHFPTLSLSFSLLIPLNFPGLLFKDLMKIINSNLSQDASLAGKPETSESCQEAENLLLTQLQG
jgi:hypothetical protein